MGRLLEKKWVCVLLSIVLAIAFWVYVRASVDPTGTTSIHSVRVETTGTNVLASQGLTIADISPQTVELRVEGPASVRSDLLRYRNNLYVQVDVSRCVEGENTVKCRPVLPENVNTEKVYTTQEPSTITVLVEKLYSQSFNVEFQLDGRVAKGYQMGTPAIEPAQVVINGPVEQVNQVAKVAAILKDSELDERFAGELPLTLLDSEGKPLTDLEVTLSAEKAYVVVPVVVTKEVPLTVNILPGGGATVDDAEVGIKPSSITVSGSQADLDALTEISLGGVELSKVLERKVIQLPINLDPSLNNESGNATAEVTITVEGLSTRTFSVENITTTEPQEGYTAQVVTQSLQVTVRGREEDLETIDASQLRVVADLSQATTLGGSRVPARVYLDSPSKVGVIGEYTVAVDISR